MWLEIRPRYGFRGGVTRLAWREDVNRYDTRLERFLVSRGIRPADLARACGYSRQHVYRLRAGRMDPTRRCMKAIAAACGALAHERVEPSQLFDLAGRP
jgi:DNA-binding Xre family transcriptional regulator